VTDLSSRYATRGRPRWFWPTVAAIGIALGVAFAAWVGFQNDPVTGRLWGYEVVDANQITVTLDIVRPDPLDVQCTVYAQAADHAIVGEKSVDVPASKREKVRITVDIETQRKAVTGVLRTCAAKD
jgi:hypothetical protein